MMKIFKNKKAQNTAEYAILIALVIAAAMAIQTYVKRGLQARVRDAVISYTDDPTIKSLGDGMQQYEPYYLKSDFTTDTDSTQNVKELKDGGWFRDSQNDETTRTGEQKNLKSVAGG